MRVTTVSTLSLSALVVRERCALLPRKPRVRRMGTRHIRWWCFRRREWWRGRWGLVVPRPGAGWGRISE